MTPVLRPYDWSELTDDIASDPAILCEHVIAVDPGAVHCGVAYWRLPDPDWDDDETEGVWDCRWAIEMTPADCVDFIHSVVQRSPNVRIIVEGFWLKPGKAALQQAGSEMETTEVIGAIRHACRRAGIRFDKVANGQDAIATRLKAAGYQFRSRGHGGHAKDAECVGVRGLGLKVRQIRMEK